ncbi:discoidin domain-containing protein [Oceanospirillum phage vB_OliS_GJ44]|nr:discoidin domain-containing protein [Oceanospirillum phage vB_OliS_GJ44]
MPVIITPVTSPADAKPVQKGSESTPADAIPVQSGAAATPADSIPSQNTAQVSPAESAPSQKAPESTPADTVPSQRTAESAPADAFPTEIATTTNPEVAGIAGADGALGFHSSRPTPKTSTAAAVPVQSSTQSTPADTVPVQSSTQATPADAVPVQSSAQATPADSLPVQSNPAATPVDAVPSQKTAVSTPADALPSQKSAAATPVDAIPSQRSAEATPADALPSQSSTVASPADVVPSQRSAQATPSNSLPSQSSTAATPADTAPVQLSTATTQAVSGLSGADGALGYHSARPVPKPESSVIPFTHPRICYQSYLDTGTVTVSSGDITAAKSKLTYDKWQPSGSTEWVKVDAGSSVDVDYMAISAHNLTGRTISLQWSDNGSTGWTTAATTAVDSNDSVVLLLTSPINKRYWRLLVSGASGMSVGVIMIGKALAVQRSINAGHSPITLSRTTVVRPAVSERGQWLGRNVIRSGLSTNIALNNLYADWYRANFDDFVEAARTEPFFFAWRPETYPDEVAFCWTTDDIAPQNVGHDRMSVSFGVDAHA